MSATTNTPTDAQILAAVEDVPTGRRRPTEYLRTALAQQAVAADPGAWDSEVTLGRKILADRLRNAGHPDVAGAMDACTRAIRAEYRQEAGR